LRRDPVFIDDTRVFIDKANHVYYLPGYGAFIQNVDKAPLDELRNKYDFVKELEDKGCQLVVGPALKTNAMDVPPEYLNGVYCRNYLLVSEKLKS
jgi:hypothetical protein